MGGWKSVPTQDWYLALKEGVAPHVMISPFEAYEILMGINREREKTPGKMEIRIGTSGMREKTYPAIKIMTGTSEFSWGDLGEKQPLLEMARIQGGIPDATCG